MRRVALKGIWWRRGRAVLTAFAVVLGVAMVSGTFILTDTINKAFDTIFQDSYSNTSAVISGKEVVKDAASGIATVPARCCSACAPTTTSRRRRARSSTSTALGPDEAHRQARRVARLEQQRAVRLRLRPARRALQPDVADRRAVGVGPGQVVIDKGTAKDNGYDVGDKIGVAANGPARQYTITGLARYGKENSIGGATFAVFDVATPRRCSASAGSTTRSSPSAGTSSPAARSSASRSHASCSRTRASSSSTRPRRHSTPSRSGSSRPPSSA